METTPATKLSSNVSKIPAVALSTNAQHSNHRLQLEDNQTRDFKVPPGGVAAPTITPTPLLSWIQLWVKRAPRQCYLSATYSSKTFNLTLDITRHGTIPPPSPPLSHSKTLRCPWPLTLSASSWSIFSTSMAIAKHQFHRQLIQSLLSISIV